MELLHSARASTHQFPAIVIPRHRAFSSPALATKKRRKENQIRVVFNSDVVSLRRTATTQAASSLHASPSQEDETQQFKSSFDDYLKAMESVNKTRRERNKDYKDGPHVQSGEFEDIVEAMESVHTVKFKRKQNENKVWGSKGQIGSSEVSGQRGFKGSLRVQEEEEVRVWKGDGSRFNNLKKLDRAELNGSGVSVNLRLDKEDEKNKGNGLNKNQSGLRRIIVDKNLTGSIPDRFSSDEFSEDSIQGGRRITRMEMEERIQKLAK